MPPKMKNNRANARTIKLTGNVISKGKGHRVNANSCLFETAKDTVKNKTTQLKMK